MDTPEECREIDFEERYKDLYGCYSYDEDPELDDTEMRIRISRVRRSLGWDR